MKREQWEYVYGYRAFYKVSDWGRVYSIRNNRMLKQVAIPKNRLCVMLCKYGKQKRFYVHTLVIEAFKGRRPPGKHCLHNDGNPRNNRASNLRWGTQQDNTNDAHKHDPKLRQRHNSFIRSIGKGYYYDPKRECYNVMICVYRKQKHIGRYKTKKAALKARHKYVKIFNNLSEKQAKTKMRQLGWVE